MSAAFLLRPVLVASLAAVGGRAKGKAPADGESLDRPRMKGVFQTRHCGERGSAADEA